MESRQIAQPDGHTSADRSPASPGQDEPTDGFAADRLPRPGRYWGGRALRPGPRPRPPKLYRIGEVVGYCGLSRQTVHNYTTMGLLREQQWSGGGHRLYDESVFGRLDEIAELKAQGRSLQEIREHFARAEATCAVALAEPAPGRQQAPAGPAGAV